MFANNSIIGAPHDRVIADFDRTVSRSQSPDLSPILVLNYEGITPLGFDRAAEAQKNIGADIRNVLFLRDPLNLCASLIHRKPIIEFELVMILRQLFAERNWLQLYASAANRQS
ncbi:MAG: hypothetical protein ACR2PA_10360, partial [Hyphomicrobiaceae bacterium]